MNIKPKMKKEETLKARIKDLEDDILNKQEQIFALETQLSKIKARQMTDALFRGEYNLVRKLFKS